MADRDRVGGELGGSDGGVGIEPVFLLHTHVGDPIEISSHQVDKFGNLTAQTAEGVKEFSYQEWRYVEIPKEKHDQTQNNLPRQAT